MSVCVLFNNMYKINRSFGCKYGSAKVEHELFWAVLLSPSEMERLLEAARSNILGSSAAVLVCWPLYIQYVCIKLMEWSAPICR